VLQIFERLIGAALIKATQVQPHSGRSLNRVRSTPRIAPVLHLCVQDTSRFPSKWQRCARPDSSPLPSKRKVRSSYYPLVLPLRLVMQGRSLQQRSSAHGGCGWRETGRFSLNRKKAGPCSCICTHCCSGKRTRDEGDAGKRGEEAGGIGTGPGAALRRIMETN
jgi:hypothetical protein